MYANSEIWVMIAGIFLSITIVCGSVWYFNRIFQEKTQDALVRFVMNVFTALVAVWVCDKVIAFRTNLLTEKQSDDLFDLIKTLTLMIFSYYFGTKNTTTTTKV